MCFSAPASFIASGGLIALGGATFAVAKKKDKILIAIPILFAIQQAFEGVQWLYLGRGSTSLLAGYGFLFFALIVWPVYLPAFVFTLDKKRKRILGWFIAVGAAVAAYFIAVLATQPLRISERLSCVNYAFELPAKPIVIGVYLVAILGPLFASSRPIFRWYGLAIFAMAVVSWWIYKANFISVWCFFAAAVSSMFFAYVQHKRRRRNLGLHLSF